MALTNDQKASIRLALGYPDLYRYQNYRLEGVLNGNLSPEAEALIVANLANLAQVEAFILGTSISTAGIKRVDVIEFFAGRSHREITDWGRMYVGRISITLGVPIYSDIFGRVGYLGDQYSAGGLGAHTGNRIRLG